MGGTLDPMTLVTDGPEPRREPGCPPRGVKVPDEWTSRSRC